MKCPHCHREVSARAKNCSACGGFIPSGQHLLEDAGIIEAALSTATAKKSAPAATNAAASPPVARLKDRFTAFVLDTMVLFGVFAIVDAWIFMRWGSVEGTALNLTTDSLLLAWSSNTLILFAYGWLLEASCGATLGKVMVGLRVVKTGARGTLAAAAIRNAMRIVDGAGLYLLGALVAGCSPCRQRLGDLFAGTAVVEEEFSAPKKVLAFVLGIAVLAGAVWQVPRICSADVARAHRGYFNRVVVQVGRTGSSAYFRVARLRFDVELTSDTLPSSGM